jgi:hypothetical protein
VLLFLQAAVLPATKLVFPSQHCEQTFRGGAAVAVLALLGAKTKVAQKETHPVADEERKEEKEVVVEE